MTTTRKLSKIIRAGDLPAVTGLGKSKIYTMIADGEFPKPIPLTTGAKGKGSKGWLEDEIIEWQQQRAEARDAEVAA